MKTITSLTNEDIKIVTALHHAKYRHMHQQFIAEGIRTISTLLQANIKLTQLYVTDEMLTQALDLVDSALITKVTTGIMKKMSTASTPSGMLAVFQIPPTPTIEQLNAGIVLAQIADPGNMGTLIRSCIAMNIKTVVVVEGVDPWSPKVIQSTAGTIGYVDIFELTWQELLQNKRQLKLCALVVSGGKQPEQLELTNSLLVVGNEAQGIPDDWIKDCDTHMTIPMPGQAESLNAAVAGSIAIYLAFVHKK